MSSYGFRIFRSNGTISIDVSSSVTVFKGRYSVIPPNGTTRVFISIPGLTTDPENIIHSNKTVGIEVVSGGVWISSPIGRGISFNGTVSYEVVWMRVEK